jgi:hypothetical protein
MNIAALIDAAVFTVAGLVVGAGTGSVHHTATSAGGGVAHTANVTPPPDNTVGGGPE